MSTKPDPTTAARRYALSLFTNHASDADLTIENPSDIATARWMVTYGQWGSSETESYAVLYNSRRLAADGAAGLLTDERPASPIALYDLDDIGPEPPVRYGDLVEHDDQQLYVVSHDWEGIEGEAQLVLTLSEDPQSEGEGIDVHDYDVTLISRGEDWEDPRSPARYALAASLVTVVFNSTADAAEGDR